MARIDNLKNYLIDVGKAIKNRKRDYRKINARDYDKFISELNRSPYCARDYILKTVKNIITEKPDFMQSTPENLSAVYKDYDNFGETYYFRGLPKNNYIKFGDYYWRILRINSNGSLRIIWDGIEPRSNDIRMIGAFQKEYNEIVEGNAVYGGFKYEDNKRHGTKIASKILGEDENPAENTLNWWYEQNILNKGLDNFIDKEVGFICDRTCSTVFEDSYWNADDDGEAGIKTTPVYFGAYLRMCYSNPRTFNNPTFKFMNYKDYFTVSDSPYGNNSLKYPIGLITADEACFAGCGRGTNFKNYLSCVDTVQESDGSHELGIWTMTPHDYDSPLYTSPTHKTYLFAIRANQLQRRNTGYFRYYVNPVLNIKSNVVLTGKGTMEDPYRIPESEQGTLRIKYID